MLSEREIGGPELSQSVVGLARRFVQRWDIHAKQLPDGRYVFVNQPLTIDLIFAHLRGEMTLGAYLLDQESKARFIVLDADDDQGFSDLVNLSRDLEKEEVPSYLETSRRGGHMWLFFDQAVPGEEGRAFGQGLIASRNIQGVELYPKQDRLGDGPGSLIRMPFGIHSLSGRRYGFVTPAGKQLAPTIREQIQALSFPHTVSEASFSFYQGIHPEKPLGTPSLAPSAAKDSVSERIKASITTMEFISRFVDLKSTGSGAIGRCPFHDDVHPSFGVNEKEDYWNCFAGCGGGSIIDFWMKWRDCDFTTALAELAEILIDQQPE